MTTKIAAALLLVFSFAASVQAQQPFEVAISGTQVVGCFILPFVDRRLQWIVPNRLETGSSVRTIASGDGRRVFALLSAPNVRIVEVRPDGSQTPFFTMDGATADALAAGPDGRVFVRLHTGTYQLGVISPAGVLEATYPLAFAFQTSMDVGSDGCTIFYSDDDTIVHRIDACTGTALPDFSTSLTGIITDLDALSNGQLLIADLERVALCDSSGSFVRWVATLSAYGFEEDADVGQIAASADLTRVFLVPQECEVDGTLLELSFANGAEISRRTIGLNFPSGIVIGAAAAAAVPTASEWALALLASGIALVAVFVLKGR